MDVFLLDSTLCRPCHRRLEAIIKMQKDLDGTLHELMQQMKRLEGSIVISFRERGGLLVCHAITGPGRKVIPRSTFCMKVGRAVHFLLPKVDPSAKSGQI